jgi:hypothetical protein
MVKRLIAIAVPFVLTACGEDVRVDLTNLSGPPGSSLSGDELKLASGTALIVEAHPKEGDELSTVPVKLDASEPFKAFETTRKNRFVIVAERPGQATIRVRADGEEVRTLRAEAF